MLEKCILGMRVDQATLKISASPFPLHETLPLLLSFIVVIIGGLGSIRGTIVAALLIGMSDGIISMFFSPTLAKMASTLLVALVLVFKPEGLFGARER